MQAAQDLQIDRRVSRTQYQYILQDADAAELAEWTPKLVQKLGQLPQLADVASDQQVNGLQLNIDVDREKASRLNVLTQAIDDTLYDAFGQRQVSIIFTQFNQFRVILEVEPNFRSRPRARQDLREVEHRPASAVERVRHHAREQHAALHSAPGTIPGRDHFLQSPQRQLARRRDSGDRKGEAGNRPAGHDRDIVQRRGGRIPLLA